jgi:predicted lipoprotein with Yx(FWY)xxD motif
MIRIRMINLDLRTAGTRSASAFALAAAAALTLVLAHPSPGKASLAKGGALVSSTTSDLGRILVDRRGRTLYLFEKDVKGISACKGGCAAYWPPLLTTGKPLAGTSVRAALLGTTTRADGTLQVTYNHHPLYTFKLDTKAAQTRGQNTRAFGAEWYVVSPSGGKIDKDVDAGRSTPPSTGGTTDAPSYGYGY